MSDFKKVDHVDNNSSIRIENIKIINYKGIDNLELKFPLPRMADDPDIIIIGSENGVGKTSVLECCALLMLNFILGKNKSEFMFTDTSILKHLELMDILINSGADQAKINGNIVWKNIPFNDLEVVLKRTGSIQPNHFPDNYAKNEDHNGPVTSRIDINNYIETISGFLPNPLITQEFMMFHSYRKINEGNLELGSIIKNNHGNEFKNYISRSESAISLFKKLILYLLMAKANLFESVDNHDSNESINQLNDFFQQYVGGTINKLKSSSENTVDIQIKPLSGEESFAFDGLSSGQKEIISTLFLIWYHTRNNPSLILIDEPELHLNAQWHRNFVRNLTAIAPKNQYILATHSEDIMASVSKERRLLIKRSVKDANDVYKA